MDRPDIQEQSNISRRKFLKGVAIAAGSAVLAGCAAESAPTDSANVIKINFAEEDKRSEPVGDKDFTEVKPGTVLHIKQIQSQDNSLDQDFQLDVQYAPHLNKNESLAHLQVRNMGIITFQPNTETERTPGEIMDARAYLLTLKSGLDHAYLHQSPLKSHTLNERVGQIKPGEVVYAFPVIAERDNWLGSQAGFPPAEINKTKLKTQPDISHFCQAWAVMVLQPGESEYQFHATVLGYINDPRVLEPYQVTSK